MFMRKPNHSFKQTLSRAFCLSAVTIFLGMSNSAWALFADDDARKAILDLRKSLATTQMDLQNQIEKLKADNAELRGKVENLEKQGEDQTRVEGIYGPNANMWSSFLYAYLIVGSAGLFSGILGACQYVLEMTPWGLWIFGALLAIAAGLYLLAQFGQKVGAQQTFLLHQIYESAVGRPAEIE